MCDSFLKDFDILNGSHIVEQHQACLKDKLTLLNEEEERLQKGIHSSFVLIFIENKEKY